MSSIQGWNDEGLDGHFTQLRHVSDNADDKLGHVWFQKMKKVAQELDEAMNFISTCGNSLTCLNGRLKPVKMR